ncbi:hypothetical protein JAAARDRAFT_192907 [Jaapia argillacea MUCL 33604]|uniref:Uncharacterized protein n=1 Tax=Jaapia argillacea MUCL 33604 TaxID=933084 RepID=A0A067PU23_9AGAM|nr:hypothetical protein JAAARDRAFT_192907 [Jaapia argillacea MUCL 33604]
MSNHDISRHSPSGRPFRSRQFEIPNTTVGRASSSEGCVSLWIATMQHPVHHLPPSTTMDPLPVIHLTDFTITSLYGKHPSLVNNAQIFLQLTLDGEVLYETVPGEREPDKQVWRVQDCVDVPKDDISLFSIAVVLDNMNHSTMQLASVELTVQDIPFKKQTLKITQDLADLNIILEFSANHGFNDPDSPLLPKSAHCEPATATGTPSSTADVYKTQTPLFNDGSISPSQITKGLSPEAPDYTYARILVEPDVEERAAKLDMLGDLSLMHYRNHHQLESLHRAVSAYEDAVQMATPDSPQKFIYLNDLGSSLLSLFECLGNIADINKSISTLQDGVRLTPVGHPNKPYYLNNLGISLVRRFDCIGNVADINDSIKVEEDAIQLTPNGHSYKADYLNNLGNSLIRRFECFGNITDIKKSISALQDAVQLTPNGHPNKPSYLNNLGTSLLCRFEHLGNIADIDDSIKMKKNAIQLTSNGHSDKPSALNNLGTSLVRRFERFGNIADIENSIMVQEDALRLIPNGHPDKPSCLNDLGTSLLYRFQRLGDTTNINYSVRVEEDAIRLTPNAHPSKPSRLNNLGISLHCHFEHLGENADIVKAISTLQDAVQLTPDGHPDKPSCLNNLGNSLVRQFEHLGNITDIDNSISTLQYAVQLTPDGHPDKPGCLTNLGASLLCHFEHSRDEAMFELAMKTLSTAAQSNVGSLSVQFQAGITWAQQAQKAHHTSLLTAYSTLLTLLPQLAWLGLPMHERHRELTEAGNLARDAASAAIEAGQFGTAVEWLEQGRSVVWGQLLQLRTPINKLQQVHPQLAAQFTQVSGQLQQTSTPSHSSGTSSQHFLEEVAQEHCRLTVEWEVLLGEIRGIKGFDRFLLPKLFSQLKGAAHSGPVVILNTSKA